MNIVLVHICVRPERIQEFIAATTENARHSILEPGIARFDFIQESEDPTKFTLIEVYRDPEAPVRHKQTPHYDRWRRTVMDMMAEPRFGVKYTNLFPGDEGW